MKRFRKLLSLVLTVIMVLAMAAPAYAAGEGSITVDNPVADKTYTAYKIFDVTYTDIKGSYAYTMDANSEWHEVVSEYEGISLALNPDGSLYTVTTTGSFSAAEFSNWLLTNVSGKTGVELESDGEGNVTASGLELGYYFVTSGAGALCNLTTTDPSVTIHDKNDVPFEKDIAESDQEEVNNGVEIGDVVNFVITGKVPDATGFTSYIYKVRDTMSAGLTFNNDLKITIGDDSADEHYSITENPADVDFEISFDVMELNKDGKVGQEIKITYSATVNNDAAGVVSQNNAELEYSNDPTDDTTFTRDDQEKLFSAKIVIDKYQAGDESKKLQDAKFVLYKKDSAGEPLYYRYTAAEGDNPATFDWVSDLANATEVTTDGNGTANFNGLENGTYYLKETEAPDGYNLLTEDTEVTIEGSTADEAVLSVTGKVANNTGAQLPGTGGIGTTVFYAAGIILMAGAVFFVIKRKRA